MFSGIYSGTWGVSPVRMGQGMVVAIGYSFTTGHTLIHISPSRTGLPALSPHSRSEIEAYARNKQGCIFLHFRQIILAWITCFEDRNTLLFECILSENKDERQTNNRCLILVEVMIYELLHHLTFIHAKIIAYHNVHCSALGPLCPEPCTKVSFNLYYSSPSGISICPCFIEFRASTHLYRILSQHLPPTYTEFRARP